MPERILKYGGVKIRNLVPPVKINRFVNRLPENKRDSLFEIASELQEAGMIDVLNDRAHSTIDKDTIDDQMTNTGSFTHQLKGFKRHRKDTFDLPK
ncbi:hypothetical protein [Desulfosporosinus metallidurans]|uniref:Translation initiation factor 2 n=1 Tax=Desulfosporosinus metallidurans TaxID=1888891 RepID=A0A1Q8QVV7_9FIRM|nr:hypothetical protein [Desulfosporosinus metallidurans]OLN31481.1 Translation initiation factor 2 [Desulfosporosinus metallidurans]